MTTRKGAFPLRATMALACLAATLGAATAGAGPPAEDTGTGLRGVVLMGPVTPGPVAVGESDEAPFSAAFSVLSAEGKTAHFQSGDDGRFELALPPGTYTIVPDTTAPIPYPGKQRQVVTVPATGYAEVTLRFDTGMR